VSARVPKRTRVASRVIDGQAVVIQPALAEVSMLNEVGSAVWEAIDGRTAEDEIARRIADAFEVESATAAEDVGGFLDELAAAGLVEFA
jgi:hypothetical protein